MFVPQHVKEVLTSKDGAFIQTGGTRGVSSHDLSIEELILCFGPVITTEAHLAFSGTRTHSKNTVEMTALVEALSFLGPRGPVARDMDS